MIAALICLMFHSLLKLSTTDIIGCDPQPVEPHSHSRSSGERCKLAPAAFHLLASVKLRQSVAAVISGGCWSWNPNAWSKCWSQKSWCQHPKNPKNESQHPKMLINWPFTISWAIVHSSPSTNGLKISVKKTHQHILHDHWLVRLVYQSLVNHCIAINNPRLSSSSPSISELIIYSKNINTLSTAVSY